MRQYINTNEAEEREFMANVVCMVQAWARCVFDHEALLKWDLVDWRCAVDSVTLKLRLPITNEGIADAAAELKRRYSRPE